MNVSEPKAFKIKHRKVVIDHDVIVHNYILYPTMKASSKCSYHLEQIIFLIYSFLHNLRKLFSKLMIK